MTTAYAYLRVSGRGQVDGDGFPRQLEAIERYATAHDIRIVKVFREEAVCGATEWEDRPAWLEMLTSMNGCETIIIERLDRLARDLMTQEHIIADLRKRHINLVSVYEPDLGSCDPTRVLMRQILGAISQYDRCMIVLKLRGARQRMKAKTGRCEGRKPYGHQPGEAETVAVMMAESQSGKTASAIARMLNERGMKPRGGAAWHPYAVSRILAAQPAPTAAPLPKPRNVTMPLPVVTAPNGLTAVQQDVISAMTNLGSTRTAAERAVRSVDGEGLDFDSLFRAALGKVRAVA